MTQTSYLVGEHFDNYANPPHDCGPYSSLQWRIRERVKEVGDLYNGSIGAGPYYGYLNNLEVTTAAGDIIIDTGACFVDGNILTNGASVTITPTAANATYTVVAVLNDQNVTYNTSLDFPADLTDYNGVASVPEYSCRLAIYRGLPAGLTQTTTVFMIPLATFSITVGGVISNLTQDTTIRTWVNAEMKKTLVSFVGGYDLTAAAEIPFAQGAGGAGSQLTYGFMTNGTNEQRLIAHWAVPNDFILSTYDTPDATPYILDSTGATCDLYATFTANYGTCGEVHNNHSATSGFQTIAIPGGIPRADILCLTDLTVTMSSLALDDICYFEYIRDATNVIDTCAQLNPQGVIIEYFGYRR